MVKKKQVTEIRDDIFFRKLLDVSKNAVFIGWAGIYRKEYQSLLKDNLPYLRELSIIENPGFESTNISVALYVFSEQKSDTYISRVYDGKTIVYEEIFDKTSDTVEYAKKPIPAEDLRPKLSDFFKTVADYKKWEADQAIEAKLEKIKAWENGEGENPWGEERVDWEQGGNAMLSNLSYENYLKSVQQDLLIFEHSGDVSILQTLAKNLRSFGELGQKITIQLEVIRTLELSENYIRRNMHFDQRETSQSS